MVDRNLSTIKEQSLVKDLMEEKMTPYKAKKKKGKVWLGQIKSKPKRILLPLYQIVGEELWEMWVDSW